MLGCPEWLLACCYAVAKVTWVLTGTVKETFYLFQHLQGKCLSLKKAIAHFSHHAAQFDESLMFEAQTNLF